MTGTLSIEREVLELRAKNEILERELSVALRDNKLLRSRLEEELRRHLGSKADQIDPNQLEIPFEELVDAVLADSEPEPTSEAKSEPDVEEAPTERRKKGAHGRKPLPANLPRVRVEHLSEELHCVQCKCELSPMGEEVTEVLDYHPASFLVKQHVRGHRALRVPAGHPRALADLPGQSRRGTHAKELARGASQGLIASGYSPAAGRQPRTWPDAYDQSEI